MDFTFSNFPISGARRPSMEKRLSLNNSELAPAPQLKNEPPEVPYLFPKPENKALPTNINTMAKIKLRKTKSPIRKPIILLRKEPVQPKPNK